MEKKEPSHTVGGNVNWCSHYGEQCGNSLKKKTKNRAAMWSSNPTSGHGSRKDKTSNLKRYMHPNVHSSVIHNSQDLSVQVSKQPKCPSTDEWIKKMWYTHMHIYGHTHMDCYSAIRKNEIMPFAATWMELKIILLDEVNQTNIIWYRICRI